MGARAERSWIIGLGVAAAALLAALVFVLMSGGDDASSSPGVSIAGAGGPISDPSTTPSSTTTPPERSTIEIELVPGDAMFNQEGSGKGSARLDGRTVSILARTSGLDGVSVRMATLTWTVPATRFEGLTGDYQVRVRLEPTWAVNLRTSSNLGRAASWLVNLHASTASTDLGRASDTRSVGSDAEHLFRSSDVLEFDGTVPGDKIDDVVVVLAIRCQALPGTNIVQVGESSECDASELGAFNIDAARVVAAPVG